MQDVNANGDAETIAADPGYEALLATHDELRHLDRTVLQTAWVLEKAARDYVREACGSGKESTPRVDGFSDLREIGSGAMGVVYSAHETLLNRNVALKVISPGFLRQSAHPEKERQRFTNEARRAAGLHHSHIVPVYGAGKCDDGETPYFAMQLISGASLDRVIGHLLAQRQEQSKRACWLPAQIAASVTSDEQPVSECSWRDFELAIAELGRDLADALHTAHRQGIIHRDIKPGNIMLDAHGHCWMTDFGLAREAHDSGEQPMYLAGSLQYMAPERLTGALTSQCDIYSLGATIYELLSGSRAISHGPAIFERIRKGEVRKLTDVEPRAAADLSAIVARAMAADPVQRYADAAQLRDDLSRFLEGREVHARPLGRLQRLGRDWRQRPWIPLTMACLVITAVAMGERAAAYFRAFQETQKSEQAAVEQKFKAVAAVEVAVKDRDEARAARDEAQIAREEAEEARRRAELYQCIAHHQLANNYISTGRPQDAVQVLGTVPQSQQSWETLYRQHELSIRLKRVRAFGVGDWGILDAAVSSDGQFVLAADSGGMLAAYDLESGKVLKVFYEARQSNEKLRARYFFEDRDYEQPQIEWGECVTAIAATHEAATFAVVSLSGRAAFVNVHEGTDDEILRTSRPLTAIAFDRQSDNATLLIGDESGQLHLWKRGQDVITTKPYGAAVTAIISVDGQWVVGLRDGTMQVLSGDLKQETSVRLPGPIWCLDSHSTADSIRLYVGAGDSQLREYRMQQGFPALVRVIQTPDPLHAVEVTSDGKTIFTVDAARRLSQWNADTARVLSSVRGIAEDPRVASINKDLPSHVVSPECFHRAATKLIPGYGAGLLAFGRDGAVLDWKPVDAAGRKADVLNIKFGAAPRILYDQGDSEILWVLDDGGQLATVHTRDSRLVDVTEAHGPGRHSLAQVAGSEVVYSAGGDGTVKCWRFWQNRIVPTRFGTLEHDRAILNIDVDSQEEFIAAVDRSARLSLWSARDGERLYLSKLTSAGEDSPLTGAVAFSPDGRFLVASGLGQSTAVYELDREKRTLRETNKQMFVAGNGATAVGWSPGHKDVAISADDYPRYTVLSVSGPRIDLDSRLLRATNQTGIRITSTPDRRRLVVAENEGRVHFFDANHHQLIYSLDTGITDLVDTVFDSFGLTMAAAGRDGQIRIFRTKSDQPNSGVNITDTTGHWQETELILPTPWALRVEDRAIRIDSAGRVCLLYTESTELDVGLEGQLVFFREGELPDSIDTGEREFQRRYAMRAAALVLRDDDEPEISFNQRLAVDGPYDNIHRVGRRKGAGNWEFETVSSGENEGFYPLIQQAAQGRIEGVFHFSFDGFYMMHSVMSDNEWLTRRIGRQGDGMHMRGYIQGNAAHLCFNRNRINSDPLPRSYGNVVNGRVETVESMDVRAVIPTAEGEPALVVRDRDGSVRIMLKSAGEWKEGLRFPPVSETLSLDPTAIAPNGDVLFLRWNRQHGGLSLMTGNQHGWKEEIVYRAERADVPNFWRPIIDQSGECVVVIARRAIREVGEQSGWVKVLRPKK